MARSEFGRFYADDQQMREVQRSLARARGRRTEARSNSAGPAEMEKSSAASGKSGGKPKLWHQPSVRERRTEIADAMARLAAGAKSRKAEGPGETR
jgi:hypothetical protein